MDFDRHNLQPEDAGGMVDGGMDDTYIDHLNSALDWSEREIARLKAENAKLRELLRNALMYIEYEGCGVECPETGHGATLTTCDTCNRYETESCAYVIVQSARELGIEVG